MKGSLSVLKLIPGTYFNHTGNPLHKENKKIKIKIKNKPRKKESGHLLVLEDLTKNSRASTRRRGVPKIPLPTNVRSNAKVDMQPHLLHRLYKPHQIIPPLEIVLQYQTNASPFKIPQQRIQKKKKKYGTLNLTKNNNKIREIAEIYTLPGEGS